MVFAAARATCVHRAPYIEEEILGIDVSRRGFLKSALTGAASLGAFAVAPVHLRAAETFKVDSPLTGYPRRDWEAVYRDIWKDDGKFVFTCSPNDTHNCLLFAHVKNGVIVRISPTFGFGQATDLHGNKASHRWDPRACQKGLVMARKFYGDRRIRRPKVRARFLEWVEAGFPRNPVTGAPLIDNTRRGDDAWKEIDWDHAYDVAAKTILNVAQTYSGHAGAERLKKQGYDEAMVDHDNFHEAGVRTIKMRGGMPLLGVGRIFGFYRFANGLALLDSKIRGVDAGHAKGARYLDSYTWHTDLPPGHPMVTGYQTVEFELWAAEHAKLIVTWGMNWISTKMPDAHWLAEARLKGTKVINVSTDYQSTSQRADEVLVIRPGTDAALALGACKVILDEGLHDLEAIKQFTDLPMLVRMDTLAVLRARDLDPKRRPADLKNGTKVYATDDAGKPKQPLPENYQQETHFVSDKLRAEWDDFVVWDAKAGRPSIVTRDEVGEHFAKKGLDPALEGEHELTLADGATVKVQPVFALIKKYLDDNCDLQTVSELTWAPKEAIQALARACAANKGATLHATGMGPNHYFNADLKDRAMFLLAALTDGVGHLGGNVGAFCGNYRASAFDGLPHYTAEDPFDVELDPKATPRVKMYMKGESAHFYNYGDRPLRVGKQIHNGSSHMPSPTKLLWFANSNSLLGNAKWHYDVVHNTLPRIDAIFVNEWWWTASCEYADLVFAVDAWNEFPHPDLTASCTNPFLLVHPKSGLEKKPFDTRWDLEVLARVSQRLAELVGDARLADYWRFMLDGKPEVYLQRILDLSSATRGYTIEKLHADAKKGVPAIMNFRTYPRSGGWEQRYESKPWYTKTGRLEFYREEPEFVASGENLPVFREPIDSTFYEPNAILAKPHPAIRPRGPKDLGLDPADRSSETRQVRNVAFAWADLAKTKHPLTEADPNHRFIFMTPKYRHGTHTTPIDVDWMSVFFGPFGDMYRHDRRKPWVSEGYLEINPKDGQALGIADGDYVWVDADPGDRPYRGARPDQPFYEVARLMVRARFQNAIPPGVTKMFYNMYGATKGTVRGQKEREDGLARNSATNFQSLFRHGGHQSGTRAWLRPTLLTDSMVRKPVFGQVIGKGFEADVHCANGAPKESFVKIAKAEPGGYGGHEHWLPVREGLRPTTESDAMKKYLAGGFVKA